MMPAGLLVEFRIRQGKERKRRSGEVSEKRGPVEDSSVVPKP